MPFSDKGKYNVLIELNHLKCEIKYYKIIYGDILPS